MTSPSNSYLNESPLRDMELILDVRTLTSPSDVDRTPPNQMPPRHLVTPRKTTSSRDDENLQAMTQFIYNNSGINASADVITSDVDGPEIGTLASGSATANQLRRSSTQPPRTLPAVLDDDVTGNAVILSVSCSLALFSIISVT